MRDVLTEPRRHVLARVAPGVTAASVVVGGVVMALMALHVTADVGFRYLAGRPLTGTTEVVSRYYMVTLIFLPLAFVQARNEHISAGFLSDVLPARAQMLLRILSAILMMGFAALLGWRLGAEAMRATQISEQVQTTFYLMPVWPARWIPVLAMALVVFQSIVDLLTSASAFIRWNGRDGDGKHVTPI